MKNYYKTNVTLMTDLSFSLNDIEMMLPWERDVYLILINKHYEEKQKLKG